jgi:hypothetical protein
MNHKVFKAIDKLKETMNPITYLKMRKQFKSHLKQKLPYGSLYVDNGRNYYLGYHEKTDTHNAHYELYTNMLPTHLYTQKIKHNKGQYESNN